MRRQGRAGGRGEALGGGGGPGGEPPLGGQGGSAPLLSPRPPWAPVISCTALNLDPLGPPAPLPGLGTVLPATRQSPGCPDTVGPLLPARLPRCHVSRLPRVQRELLGVTPLPPRGLGRPALPPHALVHRAGCNPPCTTPHSSWPGELHLPGLRGAWTRGSLLPSEGSPALHLFSSNKKIAFY